MITGKNPVLPFLVFGEFLVFFPCEEFLVFSSVFPFFCGDFRGSVGIKDPWFFGGFSGLFPKKNKERKDRAEICDYRKKCLTKKFDNLFGGGGRLVAAPLPLTEAALGPPLRRYQGPCR